MAYNKNTFAPRAKQRADIDMGLFDYEKINVLAQIVSTHMIQVRTYNHKFLKPAYTHLRELYSLMRPIIIKEGEIGREKIDEVFDGINKRIDLIFIKHRPPRGKEFYKLFKDLEDLYLLILDLKQKIGLGIRASASVSKESSFAKKYGK